ncbi:uncharacterized protein [Temnothorax longispinosus]|uniref:THAP-type domain-containing protein n=1 Tax=Temnothorax longispinosus TaxID=300112 RepID=A0A4S2JNH4_9HYME|nr:hypothetical protein DBV15_04639 [Temnothorax longispinosus]
MVYTCNICGEAYNLQAAITFHRIPKNKGRREAWLKSIGTKIRNFKPPLSAKVCSQHFTTDSFYLSIDGKRLLKADAIPTLFHITRRRLETYPENENDNIYENLQHENEANPTIMAVSSTVTTQSDTANEIHNLDATCETLSTSRTIVPQTETQHLSSETRQNVISIDEENSQNCNKLRKQLQEANARNAMLQQKLTCLQQKNRRFEKSIKKLLTLLKHFYKRTKCYQKMLVRYSNKVMNTRI